MKWKSMGLALGINMDELDCIQLKCHDDPTDCFTEVLKEWLKRKDATWNAIVTALKSKTVNFEQLADKLEQAIKHGNTSTVKKVLRTEKAVKNGDGDCVHDERNDSEEPFQCHCGHCTLESYLEGGCSESSSYPYLNFSGLSNDDQDDLIQKLDDDTEKIERSFADFCNDFIDSLKDRGKTADELVRTVVSIDKSLHRDLIRMSDVDVVFKILFGQVSFFNYEVIDYIVSRLGDTKDNENMNVYKEKFREFCKRRIFEVKPQVYGSAQAVQGRRKFVVLAHELRIFSSVEEVKAAERKITSLLNLKASQLHLERVNCGSILLVFSISNFVAQELFPLEKTMSCKMKDAGFTLFVPESKIHQVCYLHVNASSGLIRVSSRKKT